MSSSPTSSSTPPPPNPVLDAYDSFVRDTPLVTRYVLTTLFVTWILSFFANPLYAVANIPFFSIQKLELYRILISPFVCTNALSLVFAYLSFTNHGKRLEFSMGSTAFFHLLLSIGVLTNLLFLAVCFLAYTVTQENGYLLMTSAGIWVILFGIIAMECAQAPRDSERRMFVFSLPTLYYPLALFGLFALFGGASLSSLLSIGIGYLYGYGYLDRLKVSSARCKQWEDTILLNFTRREGWVTGHAAIGTAAWTQEQGATSAPMGGFSVLGGGGTPGPQPENTTGTTTAIPRGGPSQEFPSSGGRQLGASSGSRRSAAVDPRRARLEALGVKPDEDDFA